MVAAAILETCRAVVYALIGKYYHPTKTIRFRDFVVDIGMYTHAPTRDIVILINAIPHSTEGETFDGEKRSGQQAAVTPVISAGCRGDRRCDGDGQPA